MRVFGLLAFVGLARGLGVGPCVAPCRGCLHAGAPTRARPVLLRAGDDGMLSSRDVVKSGGTSVLDEPDFSVNTILKQLESIQQGTPKNIVILGTRHCSFLHQQIIELLSCADRPRARMHSPKRVPQLSRAQLSGARPRALGVHTRAWPRVAGPHVLARRTPTDPRLTSLASCSYALVLSENHLYTSGATGTHAAAIRGALRAGNQDLLTVILPQTVKKQPREIRDLLGQVKNVIELGHDELPLDAASRICNSELLSLGASRASNLESS